MLSFFLAAIVSSILIEKKRVPPMFTLLATAGLQILGLGLLTSLSTMQHGFPSAQNGYEIIMGSGFGLSISTLIMTIPIIVDRDDSAVTMGAVAQARTLGGSFGISTCTNLLNNHIKGAPGGKLERTQIQDLLASARMIVNLPRACGE